MEIILPLPFNMLFLNIKFEQRNLISCISNDIVKIFFKTKQSNKEKEIFLLFSTSFAIYLNK